jgi:hypothetical protein
VAWTGLLCFNKIWRVKCQRWNREFGHAVVRSGQLVSLIVLLHPDYSSPCSNYARLPIMGSCTYGLPATPQTRAAPFLSFL